MEPNNLIAQFLDLINQSGFPEDRKKYWLERIASGHFDPADEANFSDELTRHLQRLDEAIAVSEATLNHKEAQKMEMEVGALPLLRKLAAEQDTFSVAEAGGFKKEVLGAEKDMMAQIEDIRGAKTTEDIEAIRKKLLS